MRTSTRSISEHGLTSVVQCECPYRRAEEEGIFNIGRVIVLNNPPASRPVTTSQTRTVVSSDAEASRVPSGLHAHGCRRTLPALRPRARCRHPTRPPGPYHISAPCSSTQVYFVPVYGHTAGVAARVPAVAGAWAARRPRAHRSRGHHDRGGHERGVGRGGGAGGGNGRTGGRRGGGGGRVRYTIYEQTLRVS